jgi:hypothetical protein
MENGRLEKGKYGKNIGTERQWALIFTKNAKIIANFGVPHSPLIFLSPMFL